MHEEEGHKGLRKDSGEINNSTFLLQGLVCGGIWVTIYKQIQLCATHLRMPQATT